MRSEDRFSFLKSLPAEPISWEKPKKDTHANKSIKDFFILLKFERVLASIMPKKWKEQSSVW